MKLASFILNDTPTWGAVDGDSVIDLGGLAPTLKDALAGGLLGAAAERAAGQGPSAALADVDLLPVIPDPDKVICVGLNYKSHIEETGRGDSDYPVLFTRWANTQVGHGAPMIRPVNSTAYDYEGELAVIVGSAARHVSEADALGHVAGYSCYNDGSIRDWQRHTHQFTPGKNFEGSGGFGPWMVTTDEIPDPSALHLKTRLNGQEVQNSTTDLLIFTVPVLIEYISGFTTLEPGDVIVTGTPGGVGFKRNPPLFMKDGDTVEVDIDRIGVLANPVRDE